MHATTRVIDRSKKELEAEAMKLGERVFAEKPKAMVRRFKRYWRVWRNGD